MNPRSIRFRLVGWYALWLGIPCVVAGLLLYLGLRHYLEQNLAEIQTHRAERIGLLVQRVEADPGRNLVAEITTDFAPEASERFVRVSRPDGAILYESGTPHDRSFEPAMISKPPLHPGIRKEKVNPGNELVIVTHPSDASRSPRFYVESGESLAPALNELQRLLNTLGLGFAVVAVVALVGGNFLVGHALNPVGEITRSAERITSRNLSERLPVPPTGDEFEHLSHTLNWMIIRMEAAFQHNRRFLADA